MSDIPYTINFDRLRAKAREAGERVEIPFENDALYQKGVTIIDEMADPELIEMIENIILQVGTLNLPAAQAMYLLAEPAADLYDRYMAVAVKERLDLITELTK